MVVTEGFVEGEGIGREVNTLVDNGGWVDGRGVGSWVEQLMDEWGVG